MEKIIDLHVHTNCSDGKLSPKEVIDLAYKNKVSVLAIADHDTIDAYTDDLFFYAKEKGIKIIPAVEISTKGKKCGMHILGYNINLDDYQFREQLKKLRNIRHDYLKEVSEKLISLGYIVNYDELSLIEAVTKAHIALNIVSNKNNENKLIEVFGHIPDKGEFIETIMNEGCPAYVKKNTVSPLDAAKLIRQGGGKVVLAHPVAYKYEDGLNEDDILKVIKEINADGVEANYIYIDRKGYKINEIDTWKKFAYDNNLKITIGSDFHESDDIHPTIGLLNEEINLNTNDITSILDWLEN